MPTAAGGPLCRQSPAGARAALVLGTGERDSSCGRGEERGSLRGVPVEGSRPDPAATTLCRRAATHGDTRHLRRVKGTERGRRHRRAVPHPGAQRQPPPSPQRPRRRHVAPHARLSTAPPPRLRPPIGCPAPPLPARAAMAPAEAEVLRRRGLLGNALPAHRAGAGGSGVSIGRAGPT